MGINIQKHSINNKNTLSKYKYTFWHSKERASWYFLIIKANMTHYVSTLFGKELYMFRTDLLSIIRILNTVIRTELSSILTSLADSQHNYMTNNYYCEYSIKTSHEERKSFRNM